MRKYHRECGWKRKKKWKIFFMVFLCWRRHSKKNELKFFADVHSKYCSENPKKWSRSSTVYLHWIFGQSGNIQNISPNISYEKNGMKRIYFHIIIPLSSCHISRLLARPRVHSLQNFFKTSFICLDFFFAIFASLFLHMRFNFGPKSVSENWLASRIKDCFE